MIIGTAGHIDHGKTTLVKALTGVDTDRLKEEKARGISIELGYAYLPAANGDVLGFVDVPGHERFIHHMLAGAQGVDFVALVIAADDGPMPTTREHLQILDLLGLNRGLVVLTKIDCVDAMRLDAVKAEIAALLAGTGFDGAPVFAVSAMTGEGVAELKAQLEREAEQHPLRAAHGGFRLAIDRCFTLSGIGTIVTGTSLAGTAAVGDKLVISPPGIAVRIRSMHVQNRPAESCQTGQRCALNITAPELDKSQVNRGDWVIESAAHLPTSRFDAKLRLLGTEEKPLRHLANVHVHLGTAHVLGRIRLLEGLALEPGCEMLAQITLDAPIGAIAEDRFVIRDASASRTIGGGIVLDPQPPQRGVRKPERLALLRARDAGGAPAALAFALEHSAAGVDLARFAATNNLKQAEADALYTELKLVRIHHGEVDIGISRQRWQSVREAVLATLTERHKRSPGEPGYMRENLLRIAAPGFDDTAFGVLVDQLRAEGTLAVTGAWLHLPGHGVALSREEVVQWEGIRAVLVEKPFAAPRLDQVAKQLSLKPPQLKTLMKKLAKMGEVYAVSEDRYFVAPAVRELAAIMAEEIAANPEGVAAARLRDRIGIGRTVVIEILEFFNRIGYTRRVKDAHKMRDAKMFESGR